MIKLRVPATSANMGAGFDTLGVAVGLYNRMMIEEIPEGLEVINKNTQSFIPQDTSNLIYRAMAELFDYVGLQNNSRQPDTYDARFGQQQCVYYRRNVGGKYYFRQTAFVSGNNSSCGNDGRSSRQCGTGTFRRFLRVAYG